MVTSTQFHEFMLISVTSTHLLFLMLFLLALTETFSMENVLPGINQYSLSLQVFFFLCLFKEFLYCFFHLVRSERGPFWTLTVGVIMHKLPPRPVLYRLSPPLKPSLTFVGAWPGSKFTRHKCTHSLRKVVTVLDWWKMGWNRRLYRRAFAEPGRHDWGPPSWKVLSWPYSTLNSVPVALLASSSQPCKRFSFTGRLIISEHLGRDSTVNVTGSLKIEPVVCVCVCVCFLLLFPKLNFRCRLCYDIRTVPVWNRVH